MAEEIEIIELQAENGELTEYVISDEVEVEGRHFAVVAPLSEVEALPDEGAEPVGGATEPVLNLLIFEVIGDDWYLLEDGDLAQHIFAALDAPEGEVTDTGAEGDNDETEVTIIELQDDEGASIEYVLLDEVSHEGRDFVILANREEVQEIAETEAIEGQEPELHLEIFEVKGEDYLPIEEELAEQLLEAMDTMSATNTTDGL